MNEKYSSLEFLKETYHELEKRNSKKTSPFKLDGDFLLENLETKESNFNPRQFIPNKYMLMENGIKDSEIFTFAKTRNLSRRLEIITHKTIRDNIEMNPQDKTFIISNPTFIYDPSLPNVQGNGLKLFIDDIEDVNLGEYFPKIPINLNLNTIQ